MEKELLRDLVDGEVDGIGRAGTKVHGGEAVIEVDGTFDTEDGVDGLVEADLPLAAQGAILHPCLDDVDKKHRGVLHDTDDATGDHELPEVEAIMGDFELAGGRRGEEVRLLELR